MGIVHQAIIRFFLFLGNSHKCYYATLTVMIIMYIQNHHNTVFKTFNDNSTCP